MGCCKLSACTGPTSWTRHPKLGGACFDRLRELTPEQRARMTFERTEAAREFRKLTEHLRARPDQP